MKSKISAPFAKWFKVTATLCKRLLTVAVFMCGTLHLLAYNNTLTVSNITELQSLNVPSLTQSGYTNLSAFVQGYYWPGDRGGGTFRWDANSSKTPDGGRYFATNGWGSGAGRWIRQLNGESANVKMWGAMGNWHPWEDYAGTGAHDDTTNIQNALSAMGTGLDSDGDTPWTTELLFPAGFYKVTDTLVCNLGQYKIRGEQAWATYLQVPPGIYKDILRTSIADQLIKGQHPYPFDLAIRMEDLGFKFQGWETNQLVNPTNACLVIAGGQEGFTIRNLITFGGAFGIRSFGSGNGAVLAIHDIVTSYASVAGVSIEPTPGSSLSYGHVSIHGITSDYFIGTPPGSASLVRFVQFNGVASIEDLNAEGNYGGGVIRHSAPPVSTGYGDANSRLGSLTIRNCQYNGTTGFQYNDFLVVTGEQQTVSVTIQNIGIYAGGFLIRDQLTGRNVPFPDAVGAGNYQAACRLPIQYESFSYNNGDSFNGAGSRLVIGDSVVYSFIPPTNGWYRILRNPNVVRTGGRLSIMGLSDLTEFSAQVPPGGYVAQINVIRPSYDSGSFPPTVTMARAGSYWDNNANGARGFVDVYVQRANQYGGNANDTLKISYALEGWAIGGWMAGDGRMPLLTPTNALTGIVPPNSTLQYCVTNSLTNLVTCCGN